MSDKPKLRIVSLPVDQAEAELNRLCEDYAPLLWNIGPVDNQVIVTCVLLIESEMQKMRAAQTATVGLPFDLGKLRNPGIR